MIQFLQLKKKVQLEHGTAHCDTFLAKSYDLRNAESAKGIIGTVKSIKFQLFGSQFAENASNFSIASNNCCPVRAY